ncbi:MAG: right-handed parallel beta-helix repeat-containing protein [Acetatifactor sp.]|nr:right-handed parallel beta-helix repeat-containing protein [Acetatifactor sp.]
MKEGYRKGRSARKVARWSMLLAMLMLLSACVIGCEKKPAESSEEGTESVSSPEAQSTEPSVDGEGESKPRPNVSSSELYDGFLRGEERVYFDKQSFSYYDVTSGTEKPYFPDSNGYLLKELVSRIQTVDGAEAEASIRVTGVSFVTIDCGNDGEPELCLQVACAGDAWGGANTYEFVIKNFDGKLQVCHRNVSGYRSYSDVINHYGYVSDGYYWGMGWSSSYGFIDGDGNYHYTFGVTADSGYAWIGGEDALSKAMAEAAENEGEQVFDYFDILEYRFQEWKEGENESEIVKYSCDIYVDGEDARKDTWDLVEKIFTKAGLKLYSEAEIQSMIDQRLQEFGLTRAMSEYEYDGMEWKSVDQKDYWPGKVVNVKTTDEFIMALGDNTMIYLEPGTYNLTQWLRDEGGFEKIPRWLFEDEGVNPAGISYTGWDPESWEIIIHRLNNLTIASADPGNPAKIVCESPMARVLAFEKCSYVDINDLVFGHEIEPGHCSGDVLGISDSNGINVKGCDLYGCGAYGLTVYNGNDVSLNDCVIHDCTYGCMNVYGGYASVNNTKFENCKEFTMFSVSEGSLYFYNCSFRNLQGNMAYVGEDGYMGFSDCQFDVKALESLQKNEKFGNQLNIY